MDNTDKTVFICDLVKPLILHKRIFVLVPPLAEHENGFDLWVVKIAKLAQELSIPLLLNCNAVTRKAVDKFLEQARLSVNMTISFFDDWEDFLVISREINDEDLFVLVSARKGSASYMNVLEKLPSKIEKYFTANSKLVIYPQQFDNSYITQRYEDISSEPLNIGIETIQKIRKDIGRVFK